MSINAQTHCPLTRILENPCTNLILPELESLQKVCAADGMGIPLLVFTHYFRKSKVGCHTNGCGNRI